MKIKPKLNIKPKLKYLIMLCVLVVIAIPITIKAVVITHDGGEFGWIVHHNYTTGNASTLMTTYKHLKTGEPAYCLEPTKETPVNLDYKSNTEMDDRIYRMLANGYPAKKITGDWKKDYYITQVAVWCLNGNYKTNTLTGSLMKDVNKLLDIAYHGSQVKQPQINFKSTNVNSSLSSNGQYYYSDWMSVDCNKQVKGGTVRVAFQNAPSGAEFVDTQERTGPIFKVGEKFRVRIPVKSVNDNTNFKVTVSGKLTTDYAYRFKSPKSDIQDVASYVIRSRDAQVKNSCTVNITVPLSKLVVLKTDPTGNKRLQGAEFEVRNTDNNTVVKTITTNADGIASLDGLKLGNYSVKETKAPKGYDIDTDTQTFKVTGSKEIDLTFKDNITHREVRLFKMDSETRKPLLGAKFLLMKNGTTLKEVSSDNRGLVALGALEVGTYQVKEIQAPEGYIINQQPIDLNITEDKATYQLDAPNRIAKANIKLVKTDNQSGAKLSGAKFDLYDSNNSKVGSYTTDGNGEINVPNVRYGSYYFVETQAPQGYLLDSSHKDFRVNVSDDGKTITVNSTNTKVKSSVQLTKSDSSDGNKLEGATFDLYTKSGTKLGTYVTNKDGVIRVDNLTYGDYYFSEIKAPVGYNVNNSHISFTVNESTNGKVLNVECKDDFIKGNVQLLKTDSESHSKLKGVSFDLYSSNGNKLGNYVTDANGLINVNNLRYGDYYFKEVSTLNGYLLSDSKINFSIKEQGKTIHLDFTNTKSKSSVQLVKTDAKTGVKLKGVVFDLLNSSNNKIGTYTTDNNGMITVNNLEVGDYSFVETQTMQGYVLNKTPIKFNVNLGSNGKVISLSAKNNKITGSAKLIKKSATTGMTLNGAQYNLYKNDGTLVGNYNLTNGSVTVNNLEYGDYYVVETQSPVGYLKDTTPVHFSIKNDGETVAVDLKDKPINVTVNLIKRDKETKQPLAGASFDLYNGVNRLGTFTTNDKGMITLSLNNLPANYTFVETNAPDGYVVDNPRTEFSVGELRDNKVINLEATNTKLRGGVNLYKEDAETGAKLAGATFDLYMSNGTKVGTYTTVADGHLTVNDLVKGDYYFKEIKAPEGYNMNTDKFEFSINKQGQVVNITCKDKIYKANVELVKTDLETKTPLLATLYELHKADGTLMQTCKTNEQGQIIVQNLKYGNYYFIESQASKGYVKSTDKINFTVDAKTNGTTVKLSATNRKIAGSVILTKHDSKTGESLSGAKFKLYNSSNDLVGEYTTDNSGQIKVNNLKFGSYKFVESQAPTGYNLNTQEYKFDIANDGEVIQVKATDVKITGNVKLTKVDKNHTDKKLANAVYTLYKEDNTVIGDYTTDNDGMIMANDLEYGKYYFKEKQAPEGYLLSEDKLPFNITQQGVTLNVTGSDQQCLANVKLLKTDSETKSKLGGVVFDLYKGSDKVGSYTTNSNGEISVNDLPIGSYYFVEVTPAKGYNLNNAKLPFTITIKDHGKTFMLDMTNNIVKGNSRLAKVDSETGKPIPNASFDLFDSKSNKIGSFVTNNKGLIQIENLKYGDYFYQETKPAEGYNINTSKIPFSIKEQGKTVVVTAKNNAIKGNVKLLKIDEENHKVLSGVKFDLYKNDGTKVGSYTTNDKGLIEVNDLRYGGYYFVETKERVEYLPFSDHIKFNITEQGKTIELTQTNKPIKGKVKLVKTDNETKELIQGAKFGLYTKDGNKIGEYLTDKNGSINVGDLRYGDYYFKEIQPSTGYLLNTSAIDFKIEKHEATVNVSTTNQIIKGNVNLLKVDSETNQVIANTVFDLYNSNNVKIGTYTTDATGHLQVNNLRYGKYYFLESKASTGYLENKNKYNFDISENGKTINLTAKNDIIKGNVKLYKLDNETNDKLENTVFDLFKNDGTKMGTYTTNKDGVVEVDNLRYGDYFFKEVKPSEGYLMNDTIYKFSIREQGKTIELTAKNQVIKGNIKLLKLDTETKKPLYGAVFGLFQGDKKLAEQRTEDDGLIQFNNLRYGHYTIKELQPALGHVNDVKPFDVFVSENGKTYSYDLNNRVIKGKIRIIKYDDYNYARIRGAKFHLYKAEELEKPIADLETGHNGEIVTDNLDYGDYVVKEYDAPNQYYLNNTLFPVSIEKDGATVDVHVVDMPVKFKLLISKTDKETSKGLAGAQFQLFEDGKVVSTRVNGVTIDTFTSNEEGVICLPQELKAGSYTLKEVKAPTGYLVADPINFTIDRNTKFSHLEDGTTYYYVNVEDQIIKGSVQITKTDINNGKPLPNTTITIYGSDKKSKIFEGVTDSEGNLKFGPLNYGDYYYRESKAPEGYVIDETLHPFTIREDGKVVKCNMTDERIKGSIEITKSDINTGKLLPNTAIRILADDAKTVIYSGITDENGVVKFGPLDYGKYYYQEYKAPEGYLIDDSVHEFEIKENGEIVKAEMKDTLIRGGLEITKSDVVDGKTLPDTLFAVYDNDGNIVAKAKTDAQGVAKFNLGYGKYYYQEIVAPEGYNIDHNKYPFEIKENGVISKAKMTDSRIQSTLEITKVDAGDGKVLPNTVFEILDKDGKQIMTGTTDNNGICKFTLDYGTYYYRELKAPEGYNIDGGKYKFEVKQNGEIIKAKMKDDKIEEVTIQKIHIPITGDILRSTPVIIGAVVLIVLMIIGFIFVRRRK